MLNSRLPRLTLVRRAERGLQGVATLRDMVCGNAPRIDRETFWLTPLIERIHTGVRPHVCDYAGCGKQFIQRSALTVHQRVHTGEKPHFCEYPDCGKTFGDSSSLARHRRTHTGKRPYQCEDPACDKTFTRRTTLTAHMKTHDPTWEPDPNM